MHYSLDLGKQLHEVSTEDLERLVASERSESKTLEYKGELPGKKDADRKEFLADVSAFANTSGGIVLFGINERKDGNGQPTGVPDKLIGVGDAHTLNLDAEQRALEEVIINGITPRRPSFAFARVSTSSGRWILLLLVHQSWTGPHMVSYKNTSRFYRRTASGKHQLDVDEIRDAFLLADSLTERLREFRNGRVEQVKRRAAPTPLGAGPKIVLHLLPISSFRSTESIDLVKAHGAIAYHQPIERAGGTNPRFNFDGIVVSTGSPPKGYVQVFRNGAIEAVDCILLESKERVIHPEYERNVVTSVYTYLGFQEHLGINAPVAIGMTMAGIRGYQIALTSRRFGTPEGIDRDDLVIPEVVFIDRPSTSSEVAKLLRPMFDAVWQSSALPRSMNYDEGGNYLL